MLLGSRARLVVPSAPFAPARPAGRSAAPLQPADRMHGATTPRMPRRQARRPATTCAAGGGSDVAVNGDAWQALSACQVYLASTGEKLGVTSLWSEEERVVLAFGRSMVSPQH